MESAICQKLKDIEQKLDANNHEIHNLISTIEDKSYRRPLFLESSPANRTFGRKVDGILNNIVEGGGGGGGERAEIYIMGYFDQVYIDKLKEILSKGGKIKIISPTGQLEKGGDQRNLDALKRMEEYGAEVRIHPMLHARIFYVIMDKIPWGVVIGSGDLKADCLGGTRFDAGVWSNYPDVIESAFDFFNRVWEDSGIKKLNEIVKRGK